MEECKISKDELQRWKLMRRKTEEEGGREVLMTEFRLRTKNEAKLSREKRKYSQAFMDVYTAKGWFIVQYQVYKIYLKHAR